MRKFVVITQFYSSKQLMNNSTFTINEINNLNISHHFNLAIDASDVVLLIDCIHDISKTVVKTLKRS